MEKLKQKHITPYLPYELKLWDEENEMQYIPTLIGIKNDEQIITSLPRFPYIATWSISKFKPILIPLSVLTIHDAIEHSYPDEGHLKRSLMSGHAPYCDWIHFVSEHFDVFRLIEKGLAIDINTLEK